ncbi:MAG: siroheme synthase CysG [Alphaproteobacteria bacterium]|nr:siroheme synthase CysG [Alphaproteobacteria bacterium]MDX5368008.1 siroheme synthase CysG [Alphaproteobacteria bacterium]MDX5462855.1 siroheme synthase CysG [Alphaproteobacteria bacterium]
MGSRLDSFPAFYRIAGREVHVLGGGAAAAAKVRLLLETSARVSVIADDANDEIAALGAEGRIAHIARRWRPEDFAGAVLVFVALGAEEDDAAAADAARLAGVPVNVVDRPDLSDFTVPALVNRAPVAVAIGTEGAAPILARRIRSQIEGLLHPRLGALAVHAGELRATVGRTLADGVARRRFWERFFDGPAARAVLAGDGARAQAETLSALNRTGPEPGFVWLVGAGPGAADLLTLRAQRVLQAADVIVHDSLVPDEVVAMGRRDAVRIFAGKRKGRPSPKQEEIDALIVAHAREGARVVRLKGGDPMVYGRAGEEIAALEAAGIGYEIVPGVTSALAAAAEAALPLTLRGVASSLVFVTGHGAGGTDAAPWPALVGQGATIAVYMGKTVAGEAARRLRDAGLPERTPVAAIENASRPQMRLLGGVLADLPALAARGDLGGPVLILIGEALAGRLGHAEPLAMATPAVAA